MKFIIKKIKYSLFQSNIFLYIKFFKRTFFKDKNFNLFNKKLKIKYLGNFKTKINIFNLEELISLYQDIDYIQGFRYFIENKTKFFIHSSKSNLLYNFFSNTLNCTTYICRDNFIKNYEKNKNLIVLDKKNFIKEIKKINNNDSIFIDEGADRFDLEENILKFKYIFLKNKINYLSNSLNLYFYDKFGKINPNDRKHYNRYILYSKNKLLFQKKKKQLISGIACLKNLDIYPFDICFESALNVLDELIIGIDKQSYNKKYQNLIAKFLKQTKYKKKNKIKVF